MSKYFLYNAPGLKIFSNIFFFKLDKSSRSKNLLLKNFEPNLKLLAFSGYASISLEKTLKIFFL